jgi:hypothetical protein
MLFGHDLFLSLILPAEFRVAEGSYDGDAFDQALAVILESTWAAWESLHDRWQALAEEIRKRKEVSACLKPYDIRTGSHFIGGKNSGF